MLNRNGWPLSAGIDGQLRPNTQTEELKFAAALQRAFGGREDEVTSVALKVRMRDASVVRTTTLTLNGLEIIASNDTVIKRARSSHRE